MDKLSDYVSYLGQRLHGRHAYLPFCFACFLVALVLGLLVTQSGSGISPDSVSYITVGENVHHGKGFLSVSDDPYTRWPPLYPLSIAALMYTGIDAEQAARLVPILCFALLVFPLFFLGKTINGVFAGYVACLMCLIFTPLLFVTSYAWSEMMYILFSASALLFLVKFHQSKKASNGILCGAGFFVVLAILTKYIGIALLIVGLLVIAIKNRTRLKKMAYKALLFASISCLPIIPWLYRNIVLTSHLTGSTRVPSGIGPLTNVLMTAKTTVSDYFLGPLSEWFVANFQYYGYIGLAIIIASCFVLFAVYAKTHSAGKKLWQEYFSSENYIVISYVFIYLIALVTMRSAWTFDIISTRLTAPAYPFLILAVVSFTFYGCSQIWKLSPRPFLIPIITILIGLFLVFQVISSLSFYQDAKHGQGYNSPFWRNSQGVAWAGENVPDDSTLYSDLADLVQFRLKRLAHPLPHSSNEKAIDRLFNELRSGEDSFIICFKEPKKTYLLSNSEIREINRRYDVLDVVADFPECIIWRVRR